MPPNLNRWPERVDADTADAHRYPPCPREPRARGGRARAQGRGRLADRQRGALFGCARKRGERGDGDRGAGRRAAQRAPGQRRPALWLLQGRVFFGCHHRHLHRARRGADFLRGLSGLCVATCLHRRPSGYWHKRRRDRHQWRLGLLASATRAPGKVGGTRERRQALVDGRAVDAGRAGRRAAGGRDGYPPSRPHPWRRWWR